MELDELKKSWNALNEQLQKEPIADEQQITELIAGYKANTRKSLGRLVVIQRFSIGIGTICLATLLLIWLLLPTFGFNEQLQEKIVPFLGFIAISILAGMWWDWKTYRWNKNTHIEEMSVAEVSRRMTTFRQWTKYEVMGISIWIILFNILNYWVMEYHLRSAGSHDLAYLFPHVWTVAMDRAFMAFGLSFTELASDESGRCICLSVFLSV